MCNGLKKEIRAWEQGGKDPNWEIAKIEEEMTVLINSTQTEAVRERITGLQTQYQHYLAAQEAYWLQRSRLNWDLHGDQNTKFFHMTTTVRRRRNRIQAIQTEAGEWVVEEGEIRRLFVGHFKEIYRADPSDRGEEIKNFLEDMRGSIEKVPDNALEGLEMLPTDEEIHWAVFALGPTKAPGPDGINAALIQQQWENFGPIVIAEVKRFFATGIMKSEIAQSNLVLIPKKETPLKVTDFRPISVCNLIYKVISKLLAKRMQPLMANLISNAQTAFIPGREISENVILLREIIHSFKKLFNEEAQFVLKADLAKAFDRLNWEFLFHLLPIYGFPEKFCQWVKACVTSAKFTILLNGSGDGFFLPSRGLRQGCAMSPYLFIIAMDPLSRTLQNNLNSGSIRGLKMARFATPITCSLFADDLLLMGKLTQQEVTMFLLTLNKFSSVSGLTINQSKSKAWFSANSTAEEKTILMNLFEVGEAEIEERYLGCPIAVEGEKAFDYIIDRFEKRLNHWKSNFLSHAGRLVLIKSVLESLPIYAMGTILIPNKIITKLTAIARNFFWGGRHDKRSMAYVAWDVITLPKEMGGLGLKSLKETNQALVMKTIWKLATGVDAQWVQALRAKYYPRGAFWTIQRRIRCSKLWRQIMELRPIMALHIAWKIGNGENIPIYSQPWFPRWQHFKALTSQQRSATVAALLDPITRNWNFDALLSLFGYETALQIATMETVRPSPQPATDTLLFTFAKNGVFSVKKAYQLLKQGVWNHSDKKFWRWVWKGAQLTPKLKVFLWRAVNGALPVMAVLAIRIRQLSPLCPICKKEPETVMHALFHCEFAKQAWLVSSMPLRTETLTQGFGDTIRNLTDTLSETQVNSFVCTIWAVWRMRNEAVHGKKTQQVPAFKAFYTREMEACNLKFIAKGMVPISQQGGILQCTQEQVSASQVPISSWECYVDGAWDEGGKSGIGAYIMCEGVIVYWISKSVQAVNSNQAEAKGVLEGYKLLVQKANGKGRVLTDSLETVMALKSGLPKINDWRTYEDIWAAWKIQSQEFNNLTTFHCSRQDPRIEIAHRLAQQGKMYGWDTGGSNEPVFDLQDLM